MPTPEERTALLARFDQNMSAGIDAILRDAACLDEFDAYTAVSVLFEGVLAAGWDREALAMAYAQMAIRMRRMMLDGGRDG